MADSRIDVLAGRNPVREALEAADGRIEKVYLQRGVHGSAIDAIRRAARAAGVPVSMAPAQKVENLAPQVAHQGVVASITPVAYQDLDAMLAGIAETTDEVKATKPIVMVLDEIEDPYNFGAILRSALAAGAGGVVVPEKGQAPLSAVTVKASAGAALRIPVARTTNLRDALHAMKERGYWVVGLEGDAAGSGTEVQSVWDYDWDRPTVIVVGNEGRGIRPVVRGACDVLIDIPIRGPVESLNASVAAGIALFAAARGRDPLPTYG